MMLGTLNAAFPRNVLARFRRDRRGVAAIEFAIMLPLMLVLLLGTWEIGRAILVQMRIGASAAQLGGLVTREATLTRATLQDLFAAAPVMTGGTDLGADGVMVVTAVTGDDQGRGRVAWQEYGAGSLKTGSRIGRPGAYATLPDGMTITAGETLVVVEVFFNDASSMNMLLGQRSVYRATVQRGRAGDLATLG